MHNSFNIEVQSAAELTNFVKGLLDQMNDRFQKMSNNIVDRIDEMNNRINELESTVNKLVDESKALPNQNMLDSNPVNNNLNNM